MRIPASRDRRPTWSILPAPCPSRSAARRFRARARSALLVAATAESLVERALIDAGADLSFELDEIFGQKLLAEDAPQPFVEALDVRRGRIKFGHADAHHAKHNPFGRLLAFSGAGRALRGPENRRHHLRRQRVAAAALEAVGPLNLQLVGGREFGQLSAAIELLDHLIGLRPQPRFDLVVAPARFDLVLYLIEGPVAPWCDTCDLVPDVSSALQLNRIVLPGHHCRECIRDQLRVRWQIGNRGALGIAPGTVHRVDGAKSEVKLLGNFIEPCAGRQLIFDLIAHRGDLGLRAIERDVTFEIGLDLGNGLYDTRLDLRYAYQRDTEAPPYRIADRFQRQGERRVRHGRIDDSGLWHQAEIDVGILQAAFGDQLVEGCSILELLHRLVCFVLVWENDLLNFTSLRGRVAGQPLLIGALSLC